MVPVWSVLPFVLMLLAIAVLPLLPPLAHHWERLVIKLATSLVLGVPVLIWMGQLLGLAAVRESLWEYLQFVCLLGALFVVTGGIYLSGDLRATPRNNTYFLAVGAVLASIIGTTGAAMLLIRPLLNTNKERERKAHIVVFFTFVVANCGGLLTPLGDPPLFLGFLRGVPFAWTLTLWPQWLLVNVLLLATFYAVDARAYANETAEERAEDDRDVEPLKLHGGINFVFLAMIIAAVATVPSLDLHAHRYVPWREIILLIAAACSLVVGDKQARYEGNQFSWEPIGEVAALFLGIFATMIPALRVLDTHASGLPINAVTLNLASGTLSSVLDNAPTYVTFMELARASASGGILIAGVPELWLMAISTGAVCWGAMTYIGNGPNFMLKAVAESQGVAMPSFFGYIRESVRYLLPVLVAMLLLFVAQGLFWTILGAAVVVLILLRAAWLLLQR